MFCLCCAVGGPAGLLFCVFIVVVGLLLVRLVLGVVFC